MQIVGRPSRPRLGAYEPCRDITPPTMIRLPDVRGKLQSSFTVTYSRLRPEIIVFDTSAFSEFPESFVHNLNACCATSTRTRTPQTAVGRWQQLCDVLRIGYRPCPKGPNAPYWSIDQCYPLRVSSVKSIEAGNLAHLTQVSHGSPI